VGMLFLKPRTLPEPCYLERGKLQEQRQHTSEALLAFRRVLELDPEHDEARMRLTAILLSPRQGEEAGAPAGCLRHGLPKSPEAQGQRGKALGPTGQLFVYQPLYTNTGSFIGLFGIAADAGHTVSSSSGAITWSRAPQTAAADRTYKAGWAPPIAMSVAGGLYKPPAAGTAGCE